MRTKAIQDGAPVNGNPTLHDARTPGHHQVKIDGSKLARLSARLTPNQQVKRADRITHRAQISQAHAQTRGAVNMIGMALGRAYSRGRIAAGVLLAGEVAIAGYLAHLAGWF